MENTCITKECGKQAKTRGLCSSCYVSANGLVKKNKTTWEELKKMGMATNPKGRGKFTKSFFDRQNENSIS